MVVAYGAVKEPVKTAIAKCIHACGIASWNREYGDQGHLIQTNIVDTEPPPEIHDIVDGLLVGLRGARGALDIQVMVSIL